MVELVDVGAYVNQPTDSERGVASVAMGVARAMAVVKETATDPHPSPWAFRARTSSRYRVNGCRPVVLPGVVSPAYVFELLSPSIRNWTPAPTAWPEAQEEEPPSTLVCLPPESVHMYLLELELQYESPRAVQVVAEEDVAAQIWYRYIETAAP